MEKIRPLGKNEMHNEYLIEVKAKMDEIVDHINEQIVVDAVGKDDEEEPNGD